MKETFRYGFILGLICFLASGVLAIVNGVTEPKIKLQKEQKENSALKEVMPEGAVFKPILVNGKINYYIAYDKENNLVGFVIKSEGRGYSSDIETLAGVNLDLEVIDIKILSQNETPGLGSRISDSAFGQQFRGRRLESLEQIQAVTGATISSHAVVNSVRNKITELKGQLLKEIQNAR